MDECEEIRVMMDPVCVGCGESFVMKVDDEQVGTWTVKCGCREGFMLRRNKELLELLSDVIDESILLNVVKFSSNKDAIQTREEVEKIRGEWFPGIEVCLVDKGEIIRILKEKMGK